MLNQIFQRPNGRGANAAINPASLALARWQAADYDDQQRHYVALREWYDGDHKVPLTDRQREYLGLNAGFPWSMNYLRLPVELCVERLTVIGFDGPDGIGGAAGLLDEWWTSNRMDALQSQVHRATARDGDTYVLVEWDADSGRPRLSHEPAYDGVEGMKVHYLSNLRREMTMASKVWTESRFDERGQLQTTRRLNLYLPDRLERYIERGKGWEAYEEPGYPWPIPNPIGRIPVIHFRWRDDGGNWGESEIEPLVPLQMALNKSVLDLLEAADKTGAALLTLTGAPWPSDAPEMSAGDVLSVSAADAHWGSVPPGDLSQLREVINDFIIRMAQLSHIPLQYFQVTGQIASAATQAADDGQLVAKVKAIAVALGNAWEDAMYVALKLNQEYGNGRDLARGENIETRWASFERVDRLAVEERRAAIVQALSAAGLGVEGIVTLAALGYSQEEQARLLQQDVVTGIAQ
jgi:hypothetical protein